MKAIILAAGEGNRLKVFTKDRPKCLIPVAGRPILDWQIDTMRRLNISDIVVVKGYMAEKIDRTDVRYYINDRFQTTNMVMTLLSAREELNEDVVVSYGDIIYNDEVLSRLLGAGGDISVVVDREWEPYWRMRFDDPLKDAEALRIDGFGRIKVIGQKAVSASDIEAGYIGLIKLSKNGCRIVKSSFSRAGRSAKNGGKPWGISRPFEMAYMTDMLQGLINEGKEVFATIVDGGWLEIDSERDYELAKRLFIGGKVVSPYAVLGRQ